MDKVKKKLLKRRKMNMTGVMSLGFLAVILIGTLLLMLPVSSQARQGTDFITALFTSVSATCVTGLIPVDTGAYWSVFGQVIIIIMIQIGGLGFMTVAVLGGLLIGRTMTPRDRMMIAMSYNLNSYESVFELLRKIVIGTAIFESVGALVLMTRLVPQFGARGIWMSCFTSISAFCNAGFDVFGTGNSACDYAKDPVVSYTLIFLTAIGGIGFLVWSDVLNFFQRKKKRLSVYSKLVLIITAILLIGGAAIIALFEWNNAGTFGGLSWNEKLRAALFHSACLRTSGFASVNSANFREGTLLFSSVLMFIGGASGSTAGGAKVVTVGVLIYTVWRVALGKKEIVILNRRISKDSFTRAVAVFTVQLGLMITGTLLLLAAEDGLSIGAVLYEVASAVNTVGVTVGITAGLSVFSKLVLIVLMYLGRVGIFTVAYAMTMRHTSSTSSSISYPDANLLIG